MPIGHLLALNRRHRVLANDNMMFEGVVQVEGRNVKAWLATCHRADFNE